MHLVAVLFQVILDATLKEIQLGPELLREAEHAVFTPGQVGVVAQEAQPAGQGDTQSVCLKRRSTNIQRYTPIGQDIAKVFSG